MSKSFQVVRLGHVLIPVSRSETVVPEKTYHILGAHWYAKGLYTKDIRTGSQIQAKNLYRVEHGDFIYNRLFAWKGSFAVASEENDGCYVSNEFPCFLVNQDHVDSGYLWRYFSRAVVWEEALGLSMGGTPTSRNRLKEEKLLAMEISLPPVEEQRRIVAKIEGLASKIEEAHRLCDEAKQEVHALLASASKVAFKPKPHWSEASVGDFCEMPQYGYTESATTEPVGPRFLRITDIQNGRVNWDNVPYCSCPNPQPYFLKENDILFARTGATTGKSFLIRDCPKAVFASYLICLRVRNTVTPRIFVPILSVPFLLDTSS